MNLSADTLRASLARHPPSPHYWIAYSGGLDSRVLLRLCAELARVSQDFRCTAVHVHHGLQAAAEHWAEQCRTTCEAEGVAFRLLRVDARPRPGQSPEEAARAARYQTLATLMATGDTLLTAQHRDDQAETLLLQLLRGAGLPGLAAMPERAAFGPGFLTRPLLDHGRAELRDYAEKLELDWLEDPSNRDLGYDRNFIRHRILPVLAERWPAVGATLSRSARHCAEAQATLAALARDLCHAALNPERGTLCVDRLLAYAAADRRLVLREWIGAKGFRTPSARVLEQVLDCALNAHPERSPAVRWREGEIRRYRNELYLLPPAGPFDSGTIIAWDGLAPLLLPDGNGELIARPIDGPGIAPGLWRTAAITVRYRQGGETCRPLGRTGSRDLKKLFQEAGIPPWVRERTPLVYVDGRLVAVGGRWICQAFAGDPAGRNIMIEWFPPPPLRALSENPATD
ncbi:tRNA(Ile)-lysidine synthase [Methylomagnum ishizawai]|uniref:tRNA(Ile)-lysidine synthase n=1 Tax=Methylomagnum ishizawai TaxID=1760988 RepID=A0A1Y6D288_9GAMM|nr:tRNA lysidine(34) synthetase TilS [Methylomagnum ishizawai]SMF94672.1 tRNA(Ile)-lysidine synthase [Methylomagnum ishizawai]